MQEDCMLFVKKCKQCQKHSDITIIPIEQDYSIISLWPSFQ